ncbi:hypothetical protein M1403_01430 [Patescibacteria group bacterium]|nr:hypothetical protein [Patescibacteria group bacterium]
MWQRVKKFWTRVHYTKLLVVTALTTIAVLFSPRQILATGNQPHYTLIINQVRGSECYDAGNIDFLKQQLQTLEQKNLPATFAVRFDALNDGQYLSVLNDAKNKGFEMAGFLEITPLLASESGVVYHGDVQKWYQPGNLYLLGYSPDDRKKLIDTYMAGFKKAFGGFPKTTVSWIIDAYSLQYLSDKYHIQAHEITRDQWGTDRLTLYGGPEHYPYVPSPNWPIIPATGSAVTSPLIIRQTISDPVENYGDPTNSHTSQPNDFMRRTTNFAYFQYLFDQAHAQDLNDYTIAVIGLENSMEAKYQQMFSWQLEYVSQWRKKDSNNQVVTAQNFPFNKKQPLFTVYEGNIFKDRSSRAWWINTNAYRIRLRLAGGRLFISDLRVYDSNLIDPYSSRTAVGSASWIVPFIVDSSRWPNHLLDPIPDDQKSAGIELRNNITDAQKYSLEKEGEYKLVLYDDACCRCRLFSSVV